jgi:dTDP-4-dehydrorhamnose reductase
LLGIIHLNSEAYGIYHFANEGKISWHDFACEIYRIAQEKKLLTKEGLIQRIVTEDYPTKAQRPQNSYLSKEKIKSTFNIVVRPWQAGLQDFL